MSEDTRALVEPKKARRKDLALEALRAALKRHMEVPPALSDGNARKAAARLQSIIDAGHASTLDEAATCLVLAAIAAGKPFPWCLMDAQPKPVRALPDYNAIAEKHRQESQGVRV